TKIEDVFTKPTTALTRGGQYTKKVSIQNKGTVQQFVRVMVFPEIHSSTKGVSEERILPIKIGNEVLLDLDPNKGTKSNWQDGGDGYYYYLKALAPDETTPLLFSK